MGTKVIANPSNNPFSLHPFGPLIPPGGSISVDDSDLNLGIVKAVEAGLLTSTPPIPLGLEQVVKDVALDDVEDVLFWVNNGDNAEVFAGPHPLAATHGIPVNIDVVIVDLNGRQNPFSRVRRVGIVTDAGGSIQDPSIPTSAPVSPGTLIVTYNTVRQNPSGTSPVPVPKGLLFKRARVVAFSAVAGAQHLSLTDPDATGLAVIDTLTINWA